VVPDSRMRKWIKKFNAMSPAAQREELLRVETESFLPARAPRLSYCSDLSRVPANAVAHLDKASDSLKWDTGTAGSRRVTDGVDAEMSSCLDLSDKAQQLVAYIRERFGQRCAHAAAAVMSGCETGAEVGAHLGIARQTADAHLANIRSKDVQRKAIELGLVTRASFIKSVAPRRQSAPRARKFAATV
jgi:hypothetical protein